MIDRRDFYQNYCNFSVHIDVIDNIYDNIVMEIFVTQLVAHTNIHVENCYLGYDNDTRWLTRIIDETIDWQLFLNLMNKEIP